MQFIPHPLTACPNSISFLPLRSLLCPCFAIAFCFIYCIINASKGRLLDECDQSHKWKAVLLGDVPYVAVWRRTVWDWGLPCSCLAWSSSQVSILPGSYIIGHSISPSGLLVLYVKHLNVFQSCMSSHTSFKGRASKCGQPNTALPLCLLEK